jgi:hypothetical protein
LGATRTHQAAIPDRCVATARPSPALAR